MARGANFQERVVEISEFAAVRIQRFRNPSDLVNSTKQWFNCGIFIVSVKRTTSLGYTPRAFLTARIQAPAR